MKKTEDQQRPRAVGLISGGLDSVLAAKLILDQGFDVHVVHFAMPWSSGGNKRVEAMVSDLDLTLKVVQLGAEYLEMLKVPRYGYGSAFNPCVDCHMFMIRLAADYMREIGAEFVFTGEVLGQRPMSQRRDCLITILKETGLEGRLLRPLSAQLLKPTIPEEEGIVDRSKLLRISGRSRKEQLRLAAEWGIKGYSQPGGGCLLTDKILGDRMKDFLDFGYRDFRETQVLRWGRYFRLKHDFVAIAGRSLKENDLLVKHAYPGDVLLEPEDFAGPTVLLKGADPDAEILALAAGLSQRHSKEAKAEPKTVVYWTSGNETDKQTIKALKVHEDDLKAWAH